MRKALLILCALGLGAFLAGCTYSVEPPAPSAAGFGDWLERDHGKIPIVVDVPDRLSSLKPPMPMFANKIVILNVDDTYTRAVALASRLTVGTPEQAEAVPSEGFAIRAELEELDCRPAIGFDEHRCNVQARYTLYNGGENGVLRDYRAGTRTTGAAGNRPLEREAPMDAYRSSVGRAVARALIENAKHGLEALAEKMPVAGPATTP